MTGRVIVETDAYFNKVTDCDQRCIIVGNEHICNVRNIFPPYIPLANHNRKILSIRVYACITVEEIAHTNRFK